MDAVMCGNRLKSSSCIPDELLTAPDMLYKVYVVVFVSKYNEEKPNLTISAFFPAILGQLLFSISHRRVWASYSYILNKTFLKKCTHSC